MSSGIYDLVIEKRATFSVSLTVKNADGSNFDLSNTSLFSQIRNDVRNFLQADFTITVIGDPSDGLIRLSLTNEQTAQLDVAPSSYDLFVDALDGTSQKLLSGSVTIISNETELDAAAPTIAPTLTPRRNISFFHSVFANTGSNDEYNLCFSCPWENNQNGTKKGQYFFLLNQDPAKTCWAKRMRMLILSIFYL